MLILAKAERSRGWLPTRAQSSCWCPSAAAMAHKASVPTSPFRDDILSGRVVLITGGATGIGLGCSETFGLHGAKVAILARRKEVIDAAVEHLRGKGIEAFGVPGDVRDFGAGYGRKRNGCDCCER